MANKDVTDSIKSTFSKMINPSANIDINSSANTKTNSDTKISANIDTNSNTNSSTSFIVKKKPKEPKEEHISTYLRSDQVKYRKELTNLGYTLKEVDQMIYNFAKENMKIER